MCVHSHTDLNFNTNDHMYKMVFDMEKYTLFLVTKSRSAAVKQAFGNLRPLAIF